MSFDFALQMGDNALILGHRLSEWCGHAPVLEEDIALANTALDLIGHARMWLGYAGEVEGAGRTADDLAYHRDAGAFRNALLVEQPNGDFGQTLMRQFLFDCAHLTLLEGLSDTADPQVSQIAAKAGKEVHYHLERSADLVIRLGDGSEESHRRMQAALDALWPFVAELTTPSDAERALLADPEGFASAWDNPRAAGACRGDAGRARGAPEPHGRQERADAFGASGPSSGGDAGPAAQLSGCHMVNTLPDIATVRGWLDAVPDPEIPVISVVELGVVRDIAWRGDTLCVALSPTYSGCPATSVIRMDVETALRDQGIEKLEVTEQISPPWTTDWIAPAAREKLRAFGIAPPSVAGVPNACPHCGSDRLTRISQFGSTPCKAQWRCDACLEPFDYFKCI